MSAKGPRRGFRTAKGAVDRSRQDRSTNFVAILFCLVAVACGRRDADASAQLDYVGMSTGVRECDHYAAEVDACLTRVAPAMKVSAAPALRAQLDAWRQLALDQKPRRGIARTCIAAHENFRRSHPDCD
jgi:hypothetical protein